MKPEELEDRLIEEQITANAIAECGELIAIFVSSTRTADGVSKS